LRILKISDGNYIAIIHTWMQQVGGKWWTLGVHTSR